MKQLHFDAKTGGQIKTDSRPSRRFDGEGGPFPMLKQGPLAQGGTSASPGAGAGVVKPDLPIGNTAPGFHMDSHEKPANIRVQKPESISRVSMFGGKESGHEAEPHPTGDEFKKPKPAHGLVKAAAGSNAPKKKHFDAVKAGAGSQDSYRSQNTTWQDAKEKK